MNSKLHSNLLWVGGTITFASVTLNLIIFSIARTLGISFIIPVSEFSQIKASMPVNMVIIATIIPAILAILLFIVLRKISPRGYFIPFLSVSITALIVSLGGPASLPDTSLQTKLVLIFMHILSGFIMIGGLVYFHISTIRSTSIKEGKEY